MMQELCSFFAFPTTFAISTSHPPCLWPTMSKCQVLNCICVMPAGPICMFFVRTPDQSLVRQFLHCLLDHIATLAYSQYILAHFYFCLCFCLYMHLYFDWCFTCACVCIVLYGGRGCLAWLVPHWPLCNCLWRLSQCPWRWRTMMRCEAVTWFSREHLNLLLL